jgi:hypothetical protein
MAARAVAMLVRMIIAVLLEFLSNPIPARAPGRMPHAAMAA